METYWKVTVKMSYETKNGQNRFKKESYLVSAVSPTDAEAKLAKSLGVADYEVVGINVTNIIDVIK